MRLVFSAGGTGGHIFPALAVADEIMRKVPEADILFIGAKGKMEMDRVPKAGYPIKGLWISGFLGKSLGAKLMIVIKLIHSLLTSFFILKKHKPEVAVGFGGFASGPSLLMAHWLGVPTMIQEQNSYPGMTNRILGKRVDHISTAYVEAGEYFPKEKVQLIGNPVRQNLIHSKINREVAIDHFGLDHAKKTVLIIGGSLGARTFNRSMRALHNEVKDCSESVQFIWQVGKLYVDEYLNGATAQLDNVKALPFVERMDMAYAAADIVVARAGALTLAELEVMNKASLLIPSPNVTEDHQTKNAMALVNEKAAAILKDEDCEEQMIKKILTMLNDKNGLEEMKINIGKRAKKNAAEEIADLVLSLRKKK